MVADGWYAGADYRHLTEAALGGCIPGLALTMWDSAHSVDTLGGPESLHRVVLETETAGGVVSGTARIVRLDNSAPVAEIERIEGTCDAFTKAHTSLTVTAGISDTHFHAYQLELAGDSYPNHDYLMVTFHNDPGD